MSLYEVQSILRVAIVREKSGETEFFHHQGNTEFYLNSTYFRVATWFGKGKVMLFQKADTTELISATSSLALLEKNLFSVASAKSEFFLDK